MPEDNEIVWFKKSDVATLVAAFAVVSGIILSALELPASEVIVGGGLGYLFGKAVNRIS